MSERTTRRPRRLLPHVALLAALGLASSLPAQDDLVTLSVRDEGLVSLLQALSAQHRLNLVVGDKVQGQVTINLFDVPLEDALAQILATQGLGFVKQGDFYRVVTLDERAALLREMDTIETRALTLNHLTAEEAEQLLRPLLSSDGKLSLASANQQGGGSGGGSGGQQAPPSGHRQTIVVQDHASHLAAIERMVQGLDQPPQQVLLEATILSVDLGEENRLGVDLNVLGGIDFETVGAASDLTGIGGYNLTNGLLDELSFSGQTFGFTNDPPSQGLSLGFIRNNVAAFVEALEQTTNATIVSNPRVLALNGHQAELIVGGRLGYSTLVTTETSSIQEIQFLDTGTQLVFRPFIGDDGWIRMEVHPQNSSGIVDPATGIPSESTTEITTNILMRDGQTLILGGLIGESVSTVRSQVPVLGSIPILGALFGRTQEVIARKELVILMTPHIIDPGEAAERAEAARRRFELVRRSHWESLSPYIRPVLARNWHADAEALRARGNVRAALGAIDRALSLNPIDGDAAELRAELLEAFALQQMPADDQAQAVDVLRSSFGEPAETTGGGK